MRIEESEHLNKFEIAIAHEQLNSMDFILKLLKTKDLGVNNEDKLRIVLWLKEMFKRVKEYIPYVIISHAKARLGMKAEVAHDAYDYTKTDEYRSKEDTLFWMLGMDRRFLDHDLIKQYKDLREVLISKYQDVNKVDRILKDISLSKRGLFLLKGHELAVISKEEYEAYHEFAVSQTKDGKVYDQSLEMNKGDIYVIPTDTELYKDYEKHLSDLVKEKKQPEVKKPVEDIQKTNTEQISKEKKEEIPIPENTGYTEIKKSQESAQQKRIAKIATETPELLNGMCCKFTVVNSKIAKHTANSVFITMPKAKSVGKNTWLKAPFDLHDKVIELPATFIKNSRNSGIEVAIPLNYKPKIYDKELNPLINDKNEHIEIDATDMIRCFTITAIRELNVDVSNADIFIDGEAMKTIVFDQFKFAYGQDRAVVLGYNGKDESIKIPENISIKGKTIPVTEIKDGAFKENKSVKSIDIGKNITEIRDYAFMDCENLKTISLGTNIKDIGNGIFKGCRGLEDISLPGNIESIGLNIFEGCTGIKDYHIDNDSGLIKEFKGVLYKGTELYSYPAGRNDYSFKIPKRTTAIGENAFAGAQVSNVTISDSVKEIKYGAFNNCGCLNEVRIEGEDVTVGDRAFYNSSLIDIDVHKIKDLGQEALDNTPYSFSCAADYHMDDSYEDIPEIYVDSGIFYGDLADVGEQNISKTEEIMPSEQKEGLNLTPDIDM